MTLLIADIALWQQGLTLAQLRTAGVGAINVKISHGMGVKSVHPDAARWVAEARAAGMGVSTFHWLDNSALGADQAVHAHQQMRALGGPSGMAHVVDVEAELDPPTEARYRDYVTTMTRMLGRPIVTYSADWWWQPRGWAGKTPWLHAAPNAGYVGAYPGDTSAHWRAGYGGWDDLAVMQYAVLPVAGVRVSMSAVRDRAVWTAMTGGTMPASWVVVPALEAMRHELNDTFPTRDKTSDGGIGNPEHANRRSGHNPDETGVPEDYDADDINEVRSRDFDTDLRHPTVSMEDVCQYLLREVRAGRATWIKYLIFNGRIWKRSASWVQETYSGANPHDKHLHVSCRPETVHENDTRPLGLATLLEDDMPTAAEIAAALRPAIRAELKTELTDQLDDIAAAVWGTRLVDPRSATKPPETKTAGTYQRYNDLKHDATQAEARKAVVAEGTVLREMLGAVMLKLGATADELQSFNARERDEVPLTEERMAQLIDEAIPDSAGPLTPDEARAAVLGALRTAFSGDQS